MKLSKSSILMYLNCPRSFFYKYFTCIRGAKLSYGEKGKIVHKSIENFYKNNSPLDLSIPEVKIFNDLKLRKPLFTELKLEDEEFIGYIDRITEDGIYDYKTSNLAFRHYIFELLFYVFLYKRITNNDVRYIGIIYLNSKRKKKIIKHKIEQSEMDWCLNTVTFVQKQIALKNFDKGNNPNCYFCPYKQICYNQKSKGL